MFKMYFYETESNCYDTTKSSCKFQNSKLIPQFKICYIIFYTS